MFVFLFMPAFLSTFLLDSKIRGIPNFGFTSAMIVFLLGFLSSRQYNLDRVAVKHVVLSFRFPIFVVLLSQWIALDVRKAYLVLTQQNSNNYDLTPWDVAAALALAVAFCLCLLFDCSPHLPASIQILVSVRCRCNPYPELHFLLLVQAGCWAIFGVRCFREMRRVYVGEDADCFWDIGAYQVCDASQKVSIYSSLFLLMTQALLSRIFVPGKSNFVNASVRLSLRQRLAREVDTSQILRWSSGQGSDQPKDQFGDDAELPVAADAAGDTNEL
jgi:hypothetical protein